MNNLTTHYLNARVMINPKDKPTSLYPYYVYDYSVKDDELVLYSINACDDIPKYVYLSDILPFILDDYIIKDEYGNILTSYEYVDDWDFYGDGEDIFVFYHGERYYRDYNKGRFDWVKGNYKERTKLRK